MINYKRGRKYKKNKINKLFEALTIKIQFFKIKKLICKNLIVLIRTNL